MEEQIGPNDEVIGSSPIRSTIFHKTNYIYLGMRKSNLKQFIRECFIEVVRDNYILLETLLLKKGDSRKFGKVLVVVSDEEDQKKARQETFRNKGQLYQLGFKWDADLNSWVIPQSQLQRAQEALVRINRKPMEKLIDKIEEVPDFIKNTDNLSRKEELVAKIDAFVDELSTSVDAASKSKEIQEFLAFNARFYKYSFHNTLLIWLQNRNATKVAGFRQWEEKFFRRVKKGAKAISILAPISTKPKEPTAIATPTGKPDDAEGDEGDKEKDTARRFIRFVAVNVFDIADTEPIDARGEIPSVGWHGSDEPNEVADKVFNYATELANDMGVKVTQDVSKSGEQGWSAGDHLNLSSNISGVNRASTMVHEIAHELLHHKKTSPFYIGDEEGAEITTESKELQAEAVSYIVMKYYGLPVTHQANYLALWKANKDSVKRNLTVIKKTADFIITEIDKIQSATANAPTEPVSA